MIALDVHAHLAPIDEPRLHHLPGVRWQADARVLTLDGQSVRLAALFEPACLLGWMDQHGVKQAWVSVPPPLYRQHLSAEAALPWVRYLNEGLLAIAQVHPDRLAALFYLPMEHPRLWPALLPTCTQQGFVGLSVAAGGHPDIVYAAPHCEPLWAQLDAWGSFVFIHPGACGDKRLAQFYLENLLGNPYETGLAAAHLVMAGVPARHPRIRFCLAHAGGIFSALVGRLQHGFDTERPGVDLTQEPPMRAARRFYADGIAHHPSMLRLAQDIMGPDHVLFGSDWPFPMGIAQPSL